MKKTTVLFDLDGTLIDLNQDEFIRLYFVVLLDKLAALGYEKDAMLHILETAIRATKFNDGSRTNEHAFWDCFCARMGQAARNDEPLFEEYYRTDFQKVQAACGFAPEAAQVLQLVKQKGLQAVLATNPIFPAIATQSRIRWAGLSLEDFRLVTTYENSRFCKPNPRYYQDILDTLGLDPANCLMVGNDVTEDMVAKTLGMEVFLLTDCIINKSQCVNACIFGILQIGNLHNLQFQIMLYYVLVLFQPYQ